MSWMLAAKLVLCTSCGFAGCLPILTILACTSFTILFVLPFRSVIGEHSSSPGSISDCNEFASPFFRSVMSLWFRLSRCLDAGDIMIRGPGSSFCPVSSLSVRFVYQQLSRLNHREHRCVALYRGVVSWRCIVAGTYLLIGLLFGSICVFGASLVRFAIRIGWWRMVFCQRLTD